jgi:hypothetical protein
LKNSTLNRTSISSNEKYETYGKRKKYFASYRCNNSLVTIVRTMESDTEVLYFHWNHLSLSTLFPPPLFLDTNIHTPLPSNVFYLTFCLIRPIFILRSEVHIKSFSSILLFFSIIIIHWNLAYKFILIYATFPNRIFHFLFHNLVMLM